MRKILFALFIFSLGFTAVKAQTPTAPTSVVKFEKETHDFGTLKYAADASYTFTFTNTSKEPIVIKDVKTSCGCTTPSYSREPIGPGRKGTVTAKYDSTRQGNFYKTLTVTINDEVKVLTIKGEVEPKPIDTTPTN